MNLERDADRLIRKIALVGAGWVALCGLLAAGTALRLTRTKEPSC